MDDQHGELPQPHGAHGRPPTKAERWAAFKKSPFLPATVLVFILAIAAGLFAGSYTYTMANPTPRHIPTAVVGPPESPHGKAFVGGMEKALNASLQLHAYDSYAEAKEGIEEQEVFAILRVRERSVELDVAGAAGAQVAQVLEQAGDRKSVV